MAAKPETYSGLNLGDLLADQRTNAELTDVVLVCKGNDFPAHKLILKSTSEYFQALFRSPEWYEHNEGRIELPTVSAAEMDIILSYLYTGRFVDIGNTSLLTDLLKSSHMMQINPLFENCCEKLCKKLTSNSFLEILNLAQLYENDNMKELVLNFLTRYFTAATKSEEFLELDAFQVEAIIQRLNTRKSAMDNIVKGLIRWAEHRRHRQDSLLDILTTLDLQEMSTDYLKELLRNRALFKKNNQVITLLTAEATKRMLDISPDRKSVVCFGEHEKKQVCVIYDIELKQWSEPKPLPFPIEAFARIVWHDGFVYVVGKGSASNYTQSTRIIKYNLLTNTQVTDHLAMPVCAPGVGVLNKSIYVVNGVNEESQSIRTVQCYNPATGNCELLADTNNPYAFPKVFSFSSYLHVVGTNVGENKIERYDAECDEWTTVTNIPITDGIFASTIFTDNLYVVKRSASNECHVYDLTADSWSVKKLQEPTKDIVGLISISLQRNHIFLVVDINRTFYFCDAESGKCLWESNANIDARDYWQICVT